MSSDENSCRACLESTAEMVSLFEPYRSFTIAHFITSLTDIEIPKIQKNFPKHLCSVCLKELEVVLNFKKKCNDTDKYLKSLSKLPPAPCNAEVKEELETVIKSEQPDDDLNALDLECESDNDCLADSDQDNKYFDVNLQEDTNINENDKLLISTEPNIPYYECHDCGERLRSKCKLRVHWKRTHNSNFTCEKCKRIFKAFLPYKKHCQKECVNLNNVKIVGEGKKRRFCCRHCDYETLHYNSFKLHSVQHTGVKAYSCDICGKSYSQWGGVHDHKERVHKIYRVEMTCVHCGKHIKGRTKCYRHIQKHLKTKFQCDICKAFLKTKCSLSIHIKNHYEPKKKAAVTCEICGKVYSSYCGLKIHKQLTHFTSTHSCKLCKYQHTNIYFLRRHERRHFQENMIQCSLCYMFFDGHRLMEVHMNNKHGFKSHFCVFCKKGFKKRYTLLKHQNRDHAELLRKHTGPTYIRLSAYERSKMSAEEAAKYRDYVVF